MSIPNAALSGTFAIGGDMVVNRLGFGAMRVTGDGIWGAPRDPVEARATLERLRDLNIDFVDTAEAYGPAVSEELLAEVLAPYGKIKIATKGGHSRQGPNVWTPIGRPEFLRQGVLTSLYRLKQERLDLWQLHRIDSKVPRDEQFQTIAGFLKEGLIRHAGLSEVTVEEIEAARKHFPVATVQNRYHPADRASEAVLDHCEKHSIGFIPWRPLDGGNFRGGAFEALGRKYNASPSQLALAWLLKRSPVVLPIPGTGKVKHLEENTAAAAIQLSDEDFRALGGR